MAAASTPTPSTTTNKIPFHKRHPTFVRMVLLSLTFLIATGVGAVYGTWSLICRGSQCPSIEILSEYTPHQTSKLYAIDGRFIAELGLEKRTLVKIDEIPKIVQNAFISTEDKRFYQHAGIDWHRTSLKRRLSPRCPKRQRATTRSGFPSVRFSVAIRSSS
jgi:membrane peptidoglycan carboxypeptidase